MKSILKLAIALMALFSFAACSDVPMPYDEPGTSEKTDTTTTGEKGSTQDNPLTVTEAVELITSGKAPSTEVYVKGIVTSVDYYNSQYKSLSYYISDDGKTQQLDVYSGKGLNGADFASKSDLKVGQTVIVKGIIKSYTKDGKTTNEIDKNSQIVSIEGDGNSEQPSTEKGQTKDNPYNVQEAVDLITSGKAPSTEVYVKGIISNIDYYNTKYKSLSYYISDDGKSKALQIYSGKGLNGADFTSKEDLKVGQTVVIKGIIKSFTDKNGNKINEVDKNSQIVSIEGEGSGTTTPETPATGEGVSISGTTVTLTNTAATAGTETATIDLSLQGFEDKKTVTEAKFSDGTTITFAKGNGSTNPAFYTKTKGVRVYLNNTITFNATKPIAKIVFTCDALSSTDYVGNKTATVTFSGNTAVYTNAAPSATDGGVQLRVQTITITYAK